MVNVRFMNHLNLQQYTALTKYGLTLPAAAATK
jgi:hypothetical protein